MMIILTISTALIKAVIDAYRWPFENHWIGFVAAAVIVLAICWFDQEIYHVFLFNVFFNPMLNFIKGLSIWYIGSTAWIDKMLRKLFKDFAGPVWIGVNLILSIITI
jgi:hypothetical protein